MKTLDAKLADIRANPASRAFILTYAADGDMAYGIPTPGPAYPPDPAQEGRYPSMQTYFQSLADLVCQARLDILLTSVSTMDSLARDRRLFDNSPVTPAVRLNDTTDIWIGRGARYRGQPAHPFATTTVTEAMYGSLTPAPGQPRDVDLGLYSVTFNNDLELDLAMLERFKEFRQQATPQGLRYFLEVFNPNLEEIWMDPVLVPQFVNDQIVRMLAGIPRASRPEFLKIPYNGPAALEELVNYDSSLVIGILGGPASTTYDSFKLTAEAKKHGARVALYGRRIRDAEHPFSFVSILREVADETITPEEAVRAYRGELEKLGIPPRRTLEQDMVLETDGLE